MGTIARAAFTASQIPTAVEWNAGNFDLVYDAVNGNLDANNIANDAVTGAKLGADITGTKFQSTVNFGPTQNVCVKETFANGFSMAFTSPSGANFRYAREEPERGKDNYGVDWTALFQGISGGNSGKVIFNFWRPCTYVKNSAGGNKNHSIYYENNANIDTLTGANSGYTRDAPSGSKTQLILAGLLYYSATDAKWILIAQNGGSYLYA